MKAKEDMQRAKQKGRRGLVWTQQAWVWGVRGWIPGHYLVHDDVSSNGSWSGAWDGGLMSVDRLECVWHTRDTLEDLWGEKPEPFNTSGLARGFGELSHRCNVYSQRANTDSHIIVKQTHEIINSHITHSVGHVFLPSSLLRLMRGLKSKPQSTRNSESGICKRLYTCMHDCVCVMFACIHGRVWVCTPLLRGSGQTVHSCGGTQAECL